MVISAKLNTNIWNLDQNNLNDFVCHWEYPSAFFLAFTSQPDIWVF